MSLMMEAAGEHPAMTQQSPPLATGANAINYRVKRVGARPLSFHGSELAMAMSYTPAVPYWYEINIYRTVQQSFVLAIRLFHQSESEQDIIHAWELDTLADALDKMEQYDAAQDVKVNLSTTSGNMPIPELAATALDLRAQTYAARQHYAGLIGEFFYDLEHGN